MDEFQTLRVKFNSESKSFHTLFYKQHQTLKEQKCESKPSNRTIFVLNVPPYCTEESIKNVFIKFGTIDRVYLHSKPTSSEELPANKKNSYFEKTKQEFGFKVAYIVFSTQFSMSKSLKEPLSEPQILSTQDRPIHTGLRKWIGNYRNQFIDAKELQKEIDKYMANYDDQSETRKNETKASNEPDDEGWVTVTKNSKKSGGVLTEKNIKKLKTKEKKKKQQKELLNFYTFQMRETKKDYIAQLRQKFEEDKKRIDTMKQNRKFKPF